MVTDTPAVKTPPRTGRVDTAPGESRRFMSTAVAGLLFALLTSATAYVGYLLMFTGVNPADDEGFMLESLRSFVGGQSLYDQIGLQYGPFYFETFGALGKAGVSFDLDSGRLITLGVWLATALLAGIAVFSFTRNLGLGLAAQLTSFVVGTGFIYEPMHPSGLATLLVVGIEATAMVAISRGSARRPFALMGALAGGILLTKINLGVFAVVAVGFACIVTIQPLDRNRPLRWLGAAGLGVLPYLLMKSSLDLAWVQIYAIAASFGGLALAVATARTGPDADRRGSDMAWLIAGGVAVTAVVLVAALATGSSPTGLLHGIVLDPLQQPNAFSQHLDFRPRAMALAIPWAVLGLGAASAWTAYRLRSGCPLPAVEGAVRGGAGIVIWAALLGTVGIPLVDLVVRLDNPFLLPLAAAWVIAAPRAGRDGYQGPGFVRVVVAAIAIVEALQAYPVAGSQRLFAEVAMVPVGAIAIADGVAQLGLVRLRLQVATALLFVAMAASWLPQAWHARTGYEAAVPLGLPGASRVRVPAAEASLLQDVTATLRENCDTYISIPGMDSFYIFAGLPPPSPPTRWIWLIDDARLENAVVAASDHVTRLCVITDQQLIVFWTSGHPLPNGPIDQYVARGFVTTTKVGPYEILVRSS